MKWPIVHTDCGNIAFYTTVDWRNGARMLAEDVTLPDGSRPKDQTPMYCGACGGRIYRRRYSPWPLEFGEPIE